jgi:hypothetical protein
VATCHESYGDADDECHAKRSEHLLGSVIDPPCENILHVLKAELDARIAALGHTGSWPAIIADLDALTETEIEQDGSHFLLRSTPRR